MNNASIFCMFCIYWKYLLYTFVVYDTDDMIGCKQYGILVMLLNRGIVTLCHNLPTVNECNMTSNDDSAILQLNLTKHHFQLTSIAIKLYLLLSNIQVLFFGKRYKPIAVHSVKYRLVWGRMPTTGSIVYRTDCYRVISPAQ